LILPPYDPLVSNFERERKKLLNDVRSLFPHGLQKNVEDALGDALLDLFEERPGFASIRELDAWLVTDARNRIIDRIRHEAIEQDWLISERPIEPEYGAESAAGLAESHDAHKLMLASLDVHERAVIMCHLWLELSFEEMAARRIDGMSAGALRQTYHRAIKKLTAYILEHEKLFLER
ncbi:MAG: RNA polymerase sigma factor, partial [Candidatus Micrarchaeaceae archaeon]